MNWPLLWKILLLGILALFALMALLTTIFGARDVRKLLTRMNEETEEEPDGKERNPPKDPS